MMVLGLYFSETVYLVDLEVCLACRQQSCLKNPSKLHQPLNTNTIKHLPRAAGRFLWFCIPLPPFCSLACLFFTKVSSFTISMTSSGILKYLMVLPRMQHSGILQNLSPSLDVQITSRKLMFIQLSQLTKCPLQVSPFFNSTNCVVKFLYVCLSVLYLMRVYYLPWDDFGLFSARKGATESTIVQKCNIISWKV